MFFAGEEAPFEGLAALKANKRKESELRRQQQPQPQQQQQQQQPQQREPTEARSESSAPVPTSSTTTTTSTTTTKLQDTNQRIQQGLAIVVEAATERFNLIKENFEKNTSFSDKDDRFSGISKYIAQISSSSLGNRVYRVAKRAEVDCAIAELGVKEKCFLAFDEQKCAEFIEHHKSVILQLAFQTFSRNLTVYSKKIRTEVVKSVKGGSLKCSKLTFLTRDENERQKLIGGKGIVLADDNDDEKREVVREFTTRGVNESVMIKVLMRGRRREDEELRVRPEERVSLDLTHSAASYVFSTLRRLDVSQPVYYALGTLWQKKYHKHNRKKFRMAEVEDGGERERRRERTKHSVSASFVQMTGVQVTVRSQEPPRQER